MLAVANTSERQRPCFSSSVVASAIDRKCCSSTSCRLFPGTSFVHASSFNCVSDTYQTLSTSTYQIRLGLSFLQIWSCTSKRWKRMCEWGSSPGRLTKKKVKAYAYGLYILMLTACQVISSQSLFSFFLSFTPTLISYLGEFLCAFLRLACNVECQCGDHQQIFKRRNQSKQNHYLKLDGVI